MVTLEETCLKTTDWAIDRIHTLCESNTLTSIDDAFAIQGEFYEWLDPNSLTHDIISLEYIGDKHDD